MDPINFSTGYLDSSTDFLHSTDSDYERYGSFLQTESCPSMSSSFLTIDTSRMSFDNGGKESTGSTSPDDFTVSSASMTSPITPIGTMCMNTLYNPDGWLRSHAQDVWQTHSTDADTLWLASENPVMANCVMNSFSEQTRATGFQPGYFNLKGCPKSAADPPLSRAVFSNAVSSAKTQNSEETVRWPNQGIASYPQTVEPSATFHAALPSSPLSRYEPITPMKHHRGSSSLLPSSPSLGGSSSVLASQWDVDDSSFHSTEDMKAYQMNPSPCGSFENSEDFSVQSDYISPRKSPTSRSGLNCEAVIPQNMYACTVPGCADKDGRPRRFKRQEHKKRHERTVHSKHGEFPCWVVTGNKVCGRVFTRSDNLKSHKIKTHGRRSNNQRNAYVASLDPDSKYYDPDWTGPLTSDGYPIGHPRWPEIPRGS